MYPYALLMDTLRRDHRARMESYAGGKPSLTTARDGRRRRLRRLRRAPELRPDG